MNKKSPSIQPEHGGTSSDGMSSYYAENLTMEQTYITTLRGEPSLVSKRLSLEAFKGVEGRIIEKFIEAGLTTSKVLLKRR